MFACHWFIAMSPILHECCVDPVPGHTLPAPAAPSLTGVDRPSTSMSFHWSNTVIRQSPAGRPDSVKVPSALHLVKAKLSLVPLLYSRSSGVRLIRSVVTRPVTVLPGVQVPVTIGSVPLHT